MGFAVKRSKKPRIGHIRNNFIRASVLLGIVTPVSVYGIVGFLRAGDRLDGFGWLLFLLIAVWILVGAIWILSLKAYLEAREQVKKSLGGFRRRNLKPAGIMFNRSQASPIRMKST